MGQAKAGGRHGTPRVGRSNQCLCLTFRVNFPVVLSLKKVAFGFAAGNTFVSKPSEETSLIGLRLAEVFERIA